MNQRFRLINDDIFIHCTNAILERFKADVSVVNVIITDDDETRSHAQNRLYWAWLTQLTRLGESKEYYHTFFKRRLLAKIYIRDGADKKLISVLSSLKTAKELLPQSDYELVANQVAESVSTTKATTKQMTEYLTEIEQWAYANGVPLMIPSDLKWVME